MTINKKLFKTFPLIISCGIMFSSPVRAEITFPKGNDFTQFGFADPQCDGVLVKCFGLPNNKKYYYNGDADYCIKEDSLGKCIEKGLIIFKTNDENYISAMAELTRIQGIYDKKYKARNIAKVIGYRNC